MILIGVVKDFVGSLIMYFFQYVAYAVFIKLWSIVFLYIVIK